jgi:hypothetical protein
MSNIPFKRMALEIKKRAILAQLRRASDKTTKLLNSLKRGELIAKVERLVNQNGEMQKIMMARFAQGVEHIAGKKWNALRPSTLRNRPATRILIRTGNLMMAAIKAVANTYKVDNRKIRWTPLLAKLTVKYGKYHQVGTQKMPARRFLNDPILRELNQANAMAVKLIDQEIKKALR